MNKLQLISAISSVLLNYLTHIYLTKMETLTCKCDIDFRGNLLKTLLPLFIFVSGATLWLKTIPPVVKAILFVVYLIFDVTMFSYLTQLRSPECGCSESARSYLITDLMYYTYFLAALIVLSNAAILALIATTSTLYRGSL
jgi:hypothetical protein